MRFIYHRTGTTLFSLVICCCIFFPVAAALGSNPVKEDILTTLEKKYAGKSFEADFKQTSRLAALDITEHASGKAIFSHPGKMRWQYLSPEPHEIITNGTFLWIFRPQENQVMRGNASQFFSAGSGGAFLSDISLIRKNYIIRVKEVTADYAEIVLDAKNENPDIASITIRISQKTNEIERIVTTNLYDDTTRFDFSNIQFKKIDPALFEFKVPSGANVIDMD